MNWNHTNRGSQTVGVSLVAIASLLFGCSRAHTDARPELAPDVRIDLSPHGLPKRFFSNKDNWPNTIIGYRFVVWPNNEEVVVGFNTSPNAPVAGDPSVDGSARLLAFSIGGQLKATRDIHYLAYGYGEIVTDGKASAGPSGTVLFGMQSVNLDKEGRNESKSGVLLLDANLHDTARIDRLLEQTTFVDHALVFQEGFTLGGSRTYDVFNGSSPSQIARWHQDWPIDARDRKFGENGLAYMVCQQELRPNEYASTAVIYEGAKQRCKMIAEDKDGRSWVVSLKDGETAAIVGLLADGSVVGNINATGRGDKGGQLVIWKKDGTTEV